jgi:hypothetical protein
MLVAAAAVLGVELVVQVAWAAAVMEAAEMVLQILEVAVEMVVMAVQALLLFATQTHLPMRQA